MRALYMVYMRLEDDPADREWIIDMQPGEAAALEMRLDAIALSYHHNLLGDYGVALLEDEGPDALDEFLKYLEDNAPEEEDASAVHAGD